MTKVDFYVLAQDAPLARQHYVCKLTEKALNHQHQVTIAVDSESDALALSEHLWTFKPESFVPHHLQTEENPAPVAILWDEDNEAYHDILINLRADIPLWFSRFNRVMEVVVQIPECLQQTRQHFQFYRDRGYPLQSHNIKN